MIFREDSLKLNIELLTANGIYIPKLTEEFNTFSVQGNLILDTPSLVKVKSITLQLSGLLTNNLISNKLNQDHFLINNNLSLLNFVSYFNTGSYKLPFELALPRSLPSSFKSNSLELNYEILALVECEDQQLSFKYPFKVTNTHQVPRQRQLQSQHNHSGSIPNFINYTIKFPRRSIISGGNVNFSVLINLMNKASINYVEVKILQKSRFINVFEQALDSEKYHQVTLIETKRLLNNRLIEQVEDFSISLTKLSKAGDLLPTMETENFEITHTAEIHLNYKLDGQDPQIRFIQVPIAISLSKPSSVKTELPTYEKSLVNSTRIPTVDSPPSYNNINTN